MYGHPALVQQHAAALKPAKVIKSTGKTEWGISYGVTKIPEPHFVYADMGKDMFYAWKIEKHGVYVFGDTKAECRDNFALAYFDEVDFDY